MYEKEKIKKIQEILKAKKLDAIFLRYPHPTNRWLLGQKLENSLIMIKKSGKPVLFKSNLEQYASKELRIVNLIKRGQFEEEINKIKIKTLGVDFSEFTLEQKNNFKKTKFVDIARELSQARYIKNKEEISILRRANELTAQCFNELIKDWKKKKFTHEEQIVSYIKVFAAKHNCELAFDSVVASGINAAVPHHAESTKINKGFFVLDFGMNYKGYKADMTRTVFVGKPRKKDLQIYQEMLSIQERLVCMSLPKTKAADLYNATNIFLGNKAKYFTHSLGHGTGIEIHELPNLSPKSKDILEEGCVITIEPGIYDEKNELGIRIEDSLLIKKGKPEILTKKATKKLIVL